MKLKVLALSMLMIIAIAPTSSAGEKSATPIPTNTPWVDPGFQLALADARAQYLQAISIATTPAEKKAAKIQYIQAVRAIKKAKALVK
jgi:hypothetical protein